MTSSFRSNLLTLHRELLEAQRIDAERFSGRMSAGEVLQAAADDLRFDWLRTVSQLIAALDDAVADEDAALVEELSERARSLFVAPDADTAFGVKYLQALQDHPAVVFAHRDVVASL
jgi:gluconate kinase